MSLGKASVHARKQKSLAKCHVVVQEEYRAALNDADAGAGAQCLV